VSNRIRNRRRRSERSPGILRRTSPQTIEERQSLEHSEQNEGFTRWRAVSALIVLMFGAVLVLIFTTGIFYVRSIHVRGLKFLTTEEVFAFADVANYHLFWLDTEVVRDNILRSSSVADVSVELGWPPDMINIKIEERQPAIIWSESSVDMWVDLQGRMMTARIDLPDLMRINATLGAFDEPLTDGQQLDNDIVFGALQMQELLPEVVSLNYDSIHGLGWTNSNGWQVWMGSGTGMSEKVTIYHTLVQNLIARSIQPGVINVANPDAPFYTVLWGR
jgi:cell division septal protein FtsQ